MSLDALKYFHNIIINIIFCAGYFLVRQVLQIFLSKYRNKNVAI